MPIKADDNNQLLPPSDFDENLRLSVFMKVQKRSESYPDAHEQFTQAWGALQIRFYACTEHDEAFTESVQQHSDSPIQPYRYHQERELFNFFMNGLSAIECICYGLFSIGAMIDPAQFPFATNAKRRVVEPKETSKCYNAVFPKEALSHCLATMIQAPEYKDWHDMRRLLFHRIHPGRTFYRGRTSMPTSWLKGKSIDQNSTAIPRKWLASALKELLAEADSFVSSRF